MILTENIDVKIINHNINHYKSLNYNIKYGDVINIPINHLTKGSHYRIEVKCDICNNIKKIKYQDYIKITKNNTKNYYCKNCKMIKISETMVVKYGVDNASKSNILKKKKELTNIKNWGVKNVFQSDDIKTKSKETCIEKYGFEYPNQNKDMLNKIKLSRIKNGNQIPDDQLTKYQQYKKIVLKETRKYIKVLYGDWDGYDFYDNIYIKDNLLLESNDKKYPTIDHKISIYDGFTKDIDYKIVGNINNLCITKRTINSSKNKNSYYVK